MRHVFIHQRLLQREFIIFIIETFVTRLLQLKNEHKRYIYYSKIDKKRLWLGLMNIICWTKSVSLEKSFKTIKVHLFSDELLIYQLY